MKRMILATGGMDSTTLIYMSVLEDGIRPQIVTVDYGHAAFQKQMDMLNYHVEKLGLDPVVVLTIDYKEWQKADPLFTGKGLVDQAADDPNGERIFGDQEMRYKEMFVEGRNLIMLSYAMAYASANKIDEIWVGYVRGEAEWANSRAYKMFTGDNSPQFVDMMNLIAFTGFSHQVRIRAPYYEQRTDKNGVARIGSSLGVNFEFTHSCYWPEACGTCDNCILRRAALAQSCVI